LNRVLAIDYGTKRCGIAVTDLLQMTAQPLDTVHPEKLFEFFKNYFDTEPVETLVVGLPVQKDGTPSKVETEIVGFIRKFKAQYPAINVVRVDERYTSKMASQSLITMGAKKNQRKQKELIDKLSATLILQTFLEK
jgi:putative holliday junction resolvase|tara:strand:+ start:675 stop:1082 length:408 start_codon:yes stop_codon:yes gene_type:complete